MKKILSLILCGVLVLGITGCGNNETTTDKNNDNSNNNVQENNNNNNENKSGSGVVTCKGKSNDFANILDGMVSATRIVTYKVEDNVVTDYQVNVEVELDKNVYSKSDVDTLVQTEKYNDYITSKKSDYILNFEQENEGSHGFTWESDDMISEIIKINTGDLYGYTCEVE